MLIAFIIIIITLELAKDILLHIKKCNNGGRGMAQVVDLLPSECKIPSSNSRTAKKRGMRELKVWCKWKNTILASMRSCVQTPIPIKTV
jgi:hypothetical protein